MIVRKENNKFILTCQHDHALLSGELARHFEHFFAHDSFFEDAVFAVHEHDRSWILPDSNPIWNSEKNRPFDFIDYPHEKKLAYYNIGLNETEEMNLYAALLCSKHYVSFINDANDEASRHFLNNEELRQNRIRTELGQVDNDLLNRHFQLLQLCDNLSLYLCLNPPGVDKGEEHYFFKNGFKNSSSFNPVEGKNLIAKWPINNEVNIIPFPFKSSFEVNIEQKHLSEKSIKELGLESAFLRGKINTLRVRFTDAEPDN